MNERRFEGRLPRTLPVMLSRRFRSRLGQMVPGLVGGRRVVLEIALNVDLMLRGNSRQVIESERAGTLDLSGDCKERCHWSREWERSARLAKD